MPAVNLEFSPSAMIALNAIIALMMFGVSLELRADDFKRILRAPKAPLIGMLVQFVLLPASTCLLTIVLPIDPSLALGMILVATMLVNPQGLLGSRRHRIELEGEKA